MIIIISSIWSTRGTWVNFANLRSFNILKNRLTDFVPQNIRPLFAWQDLRRFTLRVCRNEILGKISDLCRRWGSSGPWYWPSGRHHLKLPQHFRKCWRRFSKNPEVYLDTLFWIITEIIDWFCPIFPSQTLGFISFLLDSAIRWILHPECWCTATTIKSTLAKIRNSSHGSCLNLWLKSVELLKSKGKVFVELFGCSVLASAHCRRSLWHDEVCGITTSQNRLLHRCFWTAQPKRIDFSLKIKWQRHPATADVKA